MQLTNISISAIRFNNSPFVRSLTATVMNTNGSATVRASGSNLISWNYPGQAYALTPQGSSIAADFVAPVSSIGTLYFYFSADRYDYKTTNYTLCTLNLSCASYSDSLAVQTTSYSLQYDTFPDIDFNLFINYQNTDTDTLFYRTTSTSTLTANIKLFSTNYTLSNTITSSTHAAWFNINNNSTKNYLASAKYEFLRNSPGLSSVQATLTALSAPGSLYPWFSAHSIEKELKVYFVPTFPTATFIAYPTAYFVNSTTLTYLNASNYTLSPGVCFYGEGHTERIVLSAANVGAYNYTWRVNNSLDEYNIVEDTNNTAVATITSKQDFYPKLPISLLISDTNNTYISSTGPISYYDDATGSKLYYPFYTSTVDFSGNELSGNTKYKQSISVNPYDVVSVTYFDPGTGPSVYLPLNGSLKDFSAIYDVIVNNLNALSACYDKFDTIWKWSTFEGCSAGTTFPRPSTWATVECSGTYPKFWSVQGISELSGSSPVTCTLSSSVWTLSAYTPFDRWTDIPLDNNSSTFNFSLQLSGYGGSLTPELPGFTVSRFSNTNVTLAVERKLYCNIPIAITNYGISDWPTKETIFKDVYNFTVIEPYKLYVYTPNKYVLLNEPVTFENLFLNVGNSLSAVKIVLDDVDDETIFLTGDDIKQSFTVSYSSIGDKNITITGYSQYYSENFTQTFPNIIKVVTSYDTIETEAYYNFDKILINLPWKTQPYIGSNDWVVSDNINSCIKMFYDNLDYLNKRSNVYRDTYNEYYGWLGMEPTVIQNVTACPVWTWEDVDCSIPENEYYVSWSELMSAGVVALTGGEFVNINETGSFASCGTWDLQTCTLSSVVPNCLGRYCLEWRWASRKSENATALVTWKDTSLSGSYSKKWRQPLEECETFTNANCDEGTWNIDLPGLNLYYDPIPNCYSQNRCSYNSIASYKNIIYTALDTQVKLLSSNRAATFFDIRTTFNQATPFVNIKSIALDSEQKIFILDSTLSQIAIYNYNKAAPGERWTLFTTFGGVGGSLSKTKFLNPTNIHIDQHDTVWVVDSGNFVLKQYTNTGSWLFTLRDDSYFKTDAPLDVCVDSQNNVHVMTGKVIRVYTYRGTFLFEYTPGEPVITLGSLRKIAASYNREMIYIASRSQVVRHFRTGNYSGTIINNKECVDNINSLFHDEYRNLLVANDDKILKFVDTMTLIPLKSPLPPQYWSLNDLLIHQEEYVQNWVYTKVLHRLWDNIEIFRNTLLYNDTGTCKRYKPPIYSKEEITIGQNEIVTSTVVNRALNYLWSNFNTLLEYYKTNC
jgi:hypothetical protein